MTTQEEIKQIEKNIKRLDITLRTSFVLLLSIIFWTTYYIHKELNEVIQIDLPEELPYTISKDSIKPDTVLIYKLNNKYIVKYK